MTGKSPQIPEITKDIIIKSLPTLRKPIEDSKESDHQVSELTHFNHILNKGFGIYATFINKRQADAKVNDIFHVMLGGGWLIVEEAILNKHDRMRFIMTARMIKSNKSGLVLEILDGRDSPYQIDAEWDEGVAVSGSSDMPVVAFLKT